MNQVLVEYAVNAAWQLPVLAAAAWLLVRTTQPGPATRHRIWIAVLALVAVLPLAGLFTHSSPGIASAHVTIVPAGISLTQPSSAVQAPADQWTAEAQAIFASLRFTHRIQISSRTAQWISAIYLLVLFMGLMRLLRAWSSARQLVRRSLDAELTRHEEALITECARRMGVRPPVIRVSHHALPLSGPAVVGATQPVLLFPEGFVRQLLEDGRVNEATAAILHEMAHIRRQDYTVNLICEAWTVPLRWHPVTYAITRQIRETREMACDADAALAMNSQAEYARCLVGLAEKIATSRIVEHPGAVGLFHGNALEERIMRLIQDQKTISTQARVARGLFGATAMAAAVSLAAMLQVVPANAQTPGIAAHMAQPAPPAPPALPQPAPVAVPAPPQTPAKPAPPAKQQMVSPAIQAPQAPPAPMVAQPGHPEVILSQNGKMYASVDGHKRQLTPAQRARIKKQLKQAQKKIAEAEKRINSPQSKEQMEKAEYQAMLAQKQLRSGEMQRRLAMAQARIAAEQTRLNSPQFRLQIEQAEQAAKKVNMAKIQKQLEESQKIMQKQMAAAQKNMQMQLEQLKKQQMKTATPGSSQP
jgi:beta-lactamase regulating signal transducer with metallopeptidase domain